MSWSDSAIPQTTIDVPLRHCCKDKPFRIGKNFGIRVGTTNPPSAPHAFWSLRAPGSYMQGLHKTTSCFRERVQHPPAAIVRMSSAN
eukprot:8478547-Pyramimonas_sp.AAC.1